MMRSLWTALLASTVLISGSGPQDAAASTFSKEQLEQMVGPIALYSDSLVSAVLTGATYPLEIVEADRWVDSNKDKKDDALQAALKEQGWDPSIKSLVMVPEVLKRMSTNLDWTRDLGDAFLGQKADLMAAVQTMRKKANEAGNLKTSEQQTVTVEQNQTIVIDSTNPEVVYVPEYGTSVYGSGYAYPQPYYGNMYQPGWGLVSFGAGMIVGGALWGDCNWGSGDVDIDVNRYNNFNNKVNNNWNNVNNKNWNHDAEHRGGVGYKNNDVAKKYGGGAGQGNRVASERARGKAPSQQPANKAGGVGDRGGAGDRGGTGDRGGAGTGNQRPAGAGDRPAAGGAGDRGGAKPSQPKASQQPARSSSSSGLSGASQPKSDRAASDRGNSSRTGSSGGGGGSRGGGGGGNRGGGGGGGGRGGGGGGRR